MKQELAEIERLAMLANTGKLEVFQAGKWRRFEHRDDNDMWKAVDRIVSTKNGIMIEHYPLNDYAIEYRKNGYSAEWKRLRDNYKTELCIYREITQ